MHKARKVRVKCTWKSKEKAVAVAVSAAIADEQEERISKQGEDKEDRMPTDGGFSFCLLWLPPSAPREYNTPFVLRFRGKYHVGPSSPSPPSFPGILIEVGWEERKRKGASEGVRDGRARKTMPASFGDEHLMMCYFSPSFVVCITKNN